MAGENENTSAYNTEGADGATQQHYTSRPEKPAYVREPRPHVSQPPVDDMQADETYETSYAHDTGFTTQKRGIGSQGAYRRAQKQELKVRQELKYGQYLSVPKGNREIFGSREDARKKRVLVGAVVALAVIAIALIVLWPK